MRVLAALILSASALFGADFTGIWVGQLAGRNGVMQDIAFKFSQSGKTLTGKLYGDYGSTPISDAVVSGDLLTFVVVTPEQAGNQINETRIRFTGRMQDGSLELTRDRERATNAGNNGSVQFRGATSQAFVLKRLI